ncbi:23S rRNA (guanine(2445)-N(2))/(guanine(2069)-N(7))-methyltransferase [Tamilnaduibacter salinus]|uniref:Ribosomal RNA large subunit methyltransferase K/L n=1 Tax=Tamilnaduibacter salinus TaxID=1484056 RepID=A0A2A2I5I7_9GAMM|nr:bifunctional 23S rRNA (guanine(2069)-N(7))-methyltransferase RlmK/23S rRNA (guanine(2445)-N(2))-methyltransferase RlmL [Tamilnaduibacter salinus]PAV26989.1 23S rRNA (guanine(2445)-N(2))/(guanine(2069)-N(7))-methyltransferase [Tamilnaduibacter salinus]
MSESDLFITCPKGVEYLLEEELQVLGLTPVRQAPAGVWARGSLESVYRCCLWSRLANRVVLHLATVDATDGDALYDGVQQVDWRQHLSVSGRFLVTFLGSNKAIRNSQYGTQRTKDAVVDALRKPSGVRPGVDTRDPDLRITVRLHRDKAHIGLDLSGDSLHKRGYRTEKGQAPLRENLAAALLLRSGWPDIARQGGDLTDPMCGSGTLLIEGALMAMDQAPGLNREQFGFERWPGHQPMVWDRVLREAQERARNGRRTVRARLRGYDQDRRVIATAWRNIERAGLGDVVHVERRALSDFRNESRAASGLILTNPPYGERLKADGELAGVYEVLGNMVRSEAQGWRLGVFTGKPELGHAIGLRSDRQYRLFNGRIPAQLLLFDVQPANETRVRKPGEAEPVTPRIANRERADMFANRLRKNRKALGQWARKQGIECFRVYDADMPEYAMAIDCYGDRVHVQEYAPPKSVDPRSARERLGEALAMIPDVLGVSPEDVICKQRQRQAGRQQYEKQNRSGDRQVVMEGGCQLLVNLKDYLDTGLFLDHRPVRQWIQRHASGGRFLNLFAYTGAASVHAAMGGARETLSVDMSRTYLDWARDNLQLNGFDEKAHRLEQADCLQWLSQRPEGADTGFDLIFMDPPTFSNSARMEDVLDIQRDHEWLVHRAMLRLAPGGVLIFSTNFRRFRLSDVISERYEVTDITRETIDRDFRRNERIHQCWRIRHDG